MHSNLQKHGPLQALQFTLMEPNFFSKVFLCFIPDHCRPANYENMDLVFVTATVASMDAGAELTRMYLQRVAVANSEFMSAHYF
ncbi:hypothetical protein P886_4714 [Alteromonadaceae bacterium 2753L.S.0a.02]|nr:hypothetical protein P886_4714 [Alteromonadaceae bacterium 2753L.S.0a.02]